MKNVKYEGVYPYMHNHSTRIFSLLQGEKLWPCSFKFSKWTKKWKAEAGDNQFLYKTTVKEDNKFKRAFKGNIVTIV
jgi:hypothetical protein